MQNLNITLIIGVCCLLIVCSCHEQNREFNTTEELNSYPDAVNEHIEAALNQRKVLNKYIFNSDKRKSIRETLSKLSYEHSVANVCQLIEHIDPEDTMILEVASARCNFYKSLDEAIEHSNMTLSEISDARARTLNGLHLIQKDDLHKNLD